MRSPLEELTKRAAELESAGQYASASAAWEAAEKEALSVWEKHMQYARNAERCERAHREAEAARMRQDLVEQERVLREAQP